jgi:aspartate aminotransferase
MVYSKKALSISASPTLTIDAKAKKMKAEGVDVIGFGAGEPDLDTPEHIKEAAILAIKQGFTKYTPAQGILELREAICRKLKRDNECEYTSSQIVVSNGAKHSLINAFQAILNPGDEVILPAPYWVSYPEMIKLADGVPVCINTTEESNYKIKAQDLLNKITSKTKAFVLNSPSNPTGMVYTEEELREIAEIAVEKGIFVISDEIYEELIYDGYKHVSIASINEEMKDLTIVVNGLSKAYAMTGWRIGYTASNIEIAKIMANVQSHETANPNSIAQKAAVAALEGGKEFISEMRTQYEKRRNFMVDRINSMGDVSCKKPSGAFYVMMNIAGLIGKKYNGKIITDSDVFAEALLEGLKVVVIPSTGFGISGYIRLSYAVSMKNIEEGLNRIESFVKELK